MYCNRGVGKTFHEGHGIDPPMGINVPTRLLGGGRMCAGTQSNRMRVAIYDDDQKNDWI